MVDEQQPPEDDATSTEPSGGEPRNVAPEGAEPTGPRRSTFTPPPQDAQYAPSATDDDALAGALASEFRRWNPPPRPSAAQEAPREAPGEAPRASAPEPTAPATNAPVTNAPPAAEVPPTAPQYSPSYSPPPRAVPAEPLPPAPPAPPAPPPASATPGPPASAPPAPVPSPSSPPPVATAPPTTPAAFVPPTTQESPAQPATQVPAASPIPVDPAVPALPPPPRRESLTDEQLLAAANLDAPDHDTSALLDLLEQQLQLREAEVRRLSEWEQEVRETAGPAADPLVAEVPLAVHRVPIPVRRGGSREVPRRRQTVGRPTRNPELPSFQRGAARHPPKRPVRRGAVPRARSRRLADGARPRFGVVRGELPRQPRFH